MVQGAASMKSVAIFVAMQFFGFFPLLVEGKRRKCSHRIIYIKTIFNISYSMATLPFCIIII